MTYATALTCLSVPWVVACAADPDGWLAEGCFARSDLFLDACNSWHMSALEFVSPMAEV